MKETKLPNRRARYGVYAWPYLVSMTLLGVLGIAIFSYAILAWPYIMPTGILLAIVGFYLTSAHYLLVRRHDKMGYALSEKLLKLIEPETGTMVLDIGCGTGRTAIAIAKGSENMKVIGIDIYSRKTIYGNSPKKAHENVEAENVADKVSFSYGSALNIPFKNRSFNAVTIGSVLHLFSETKRKVALEEAYRVLKDGGKLVLIEMPRTAKTALIYWLAMFFIFQTKKYWSKLLNDCGLENIKSSAVGEIAIFCSQRPCVSSCSQRETKRGITKLMKI